MLVEWALTGESLWMRSGLMASPAIGSPYETKRSRSHMCRVKVTTQHGIDRMDAATTRNAGWRFGGYAMAYCGTTHGRLREGRKKVVNKGTDGLGNETDVPWKWKIHGNAFPADKLETYGCAYPSHYTASFVRVPKLPQPESKFLCLHHQPACRSAVKHRPLWCCGRVGASTLFDTHVAYSLRYRSVTGSRAGNIKHQRLPRCAGHDQGHPRTVWR